LLVACIALSACRSKERAKPAAASSSSAAASAAPPAPRHQLNADPKLSQELDRVAETCTFLQKRETLSCPTAEVDLLKARLKELGLVALETLLAKVFDDDPRLSMVAATQMRNVYERSLGASLEKAPIPERVTAALTQALGELPVTRALLVAPAATFVLTREGRLDALVPIVERRPEVRYMVLPRVLHYPRLRAFGQVQKWATASDEETVVNALEALRLMTDWTEAEQVELEPWLSGFLTHQSNKAQGRAAGFLLECGAEAEKKALAWFEAALAEKRLKRDVIFVFGRRCRPDNYRELADDDLARLAKTPLCRKIERLLDRVAADKKTEAEVRAAALEMLTAVWPKTALRRAELVVKDENPWLAEQAGTAIHLAGDAVKK